MEVILTDITGTIGEWLDKGFDNEVPREVVMLLEKAYNLSAGELDSAKTIFDKYNKETDMVEETVNIWIDELLEKHGVNELENLSENILSNEIAEARDTIRNCSIWEDGFGIACNQYYIKCLKEALGE